FGGITSAIVINAQKGREQEARKSAETFAELAEQNKILANDQAELALNTNRVVLYKTKSFFDEHPELIPLRKSMLDSIVTDIEKIHEDRYSDGSTDTLRAAATNQLGRVYLNTGNYERAIKSLLAAEAQLTKLNKDGKLSRARESQMDLGIAIGDTYREMGDLQKAESRFLRVLKQRQDYFDGALTVKPIMKQQGMAEVWGRLQKIYQDMGKPDLMLKYALLSTEARRAWHRAHPQSLLAMEELAGALGELSVAYETRGDLDEMMDVSGEMLTLNSVISSNKSDMRTLHNTATSQKKLGRQALVMGKNEQAFEVLVEATNTFERLLEIAEDNQKTNTQAADAYYYFGLAQSLIGKDSKKSFQRAAEIQEQVVEKSNNIRTQGMLLKIYARGGMVDQAKPLLSQIAAKPESDQNCGYAAVSYALLAQHLSGSERDDATEKAIDFTRRLIQHGYHGFESMRRTDLDFRPLQDNQAYLSMLDQEQAKVEAAAATNTKQK
ncbi:MAG: tetratricopeptide repeat protein, partial [Pirellulaceae bacterium]